MYQLFDREGAHSFTTEEEALEYARRRPGNYRLRVPGGPEDGSQDEDVWCRWFPRHGNKAWVLGRNRPTEEQLSRVYSTGEEAWE